MTVPPSFSRNRTSVLESQLRDEGAGKPPLRIASVTMAMRIRMGTGAVVEATPAKTAEDPVGGAKPMAVAVAVEVAVEAIDRESGGHLHPTMPVQCRCFSVEDPPAVP